MTMDNNTLELGRRVRFSLNGGTDGVGEITSLDGRKVQIDMDGQSYTRSRRFVHTTCCERDTKGGGSCDRHSAPGVLR